MMQRVIPILSPHFIDEKTLDGGIDWPTVFGNDNPLALEIGCGTGHFVLERARQQPQVNFLAIDIYNKGCLKSCKKIDHAGLGNVRVMRVEARRLLDSLPPESLCAVYINCPDPWPKKRHRPRRLVNRDFLLALAHYLAPDADFFFSSDFDNYAEEVAATIAALPCYRNMLDSGWSHELPGYPLSKYMQRFLELGQNIYFVHFRRAPEFPREQLPETAFQRGFRIPREKDSA